MPHDVFISYSSKDKLIANAICSKLENNKIRCWIAPRDILPGLEWGDGIMTGLVECKIFLLIFSGNSNGSQQVRKEVERAVNKEKIIVPFRVEDIYPTKALELALSNTHWLDGITPPLDAHITALSNAIAQLLALPANEATGDQPGHSWHPSGDLRAHLETVVKTVNIGAQVWTSENLDVGVFRNGDIIPEANSFEDLMSSGMDGVPTWTYYQHNSEYGKKYGKLYNWHAVADWRGLAPAGFHIPRKDELDILLRHYGGEGEKGFVPLTQRGGFAASYGGSSGFGGFTFADMQGYYWTVPIRKV